MKELHEIYLNKAMNASDINEAIENMKLAVMHAKSKAPKHVFDFQSVNGTMWSDKNARVYLAVKGQLGYLYEVAADYDNAINTYKEILKMDTNDNQDIKDKLIPLLILNDKNDQAYKYIRKYENCNSAAMLYNKALYYFVEEDKFEAKLFIRKAMEANKYVPEYLIGIKHIEMPIKNRFEAGSEDEAKYYVNDAMMAWIGEKKRFFWIVDEYFGYCERCGVELPWSREFVKSTVGNVIFGQKK